MYHSELTARFSVRLVAQIVTQLHAIFWILSYASLTITNQKAKKRTSSSHKKPTNTLHIPKGKLSEAVQSLRLMKNQEEAMVRDVGAPLVVVQGISASHSNWHLPSRERFDILLT